MSQEQRIVGNCPKCGSPIYAGEPKMAGGMPTPGPNVFTCDCRNKNQKQADKNGMFKTGGTKINPTFF